MAYEAAAVKDATHIRLYCHLAGHMDGDLKPIPVTIALQEIDINTYKELFYTNFLEYNKITLADKDQQFTVPESVIACKVPEHFLNNVGFAVKLFLPPHLEKIEFLDSNSEVLYTKYFSLYNDENILVEPDATYSKWFIYSLAEKLLLNDEQMPEETYCFEYDLHKADTNAHAKDIVSLPMQLDNRSLAKKDNIYYALYTKEIEDDSIKAKAQVINGNLITNDYRLFYLGNNIYDNTDEINEVATWADGQRNLADDAIIMNGDGYMAGGFCLGLPQELWQGLLEEVEPIAKGQGVLAAPNWGILTQYMVGTGTISTDQYISFDNWSASGNSLYYSGNTPGYSLLTSLPNYSKLKLRFVDENQNAVDCNGLTGPTRYSAGYTYTFDLTPITDGVYTNITLQVRDSQALQLRLTVNEDYRDYYPSNSTFADTYFSNSQTLRQGCAIQIVKSI